MNANNLSQKIVKPSVFFLLTLSSPPLLAAPPELEPVDVQIVNSEPVNVQVNPKTSAYALFAFDSSLDGGGSPTSVTVPVSSYITGVLFRFQSVEISACIARLEYSNLQDKPENANTPSIANASVTFASNVTSNGDFNNLFTESRFVPVPNFYVEGGNALGLRSTEYGRAVSSSVLNSRCDAIATIYLIPAGS
ncbi:MAG: hypothetical protein ACU841_17910 [Gammaproteobacteria bacterium]